MTALTALLLLALGNDPDGGAHYAGASPVYQCTFDSSGEDELSAFPPGWTRRHGPGFPRYLHMRVNELHPPSGGYNLRVELNGGAAAAFGPTLAARANLQYVLEGYVETSGLRHDVAYLSLMFLDSARNRLGTASTEKLSGTSPWRKVCLGPVLPPAGATAMIIGLHVEPRGDVEDLRGTASFGGLWLGQVPHLVLTAEPAREALPDDAMANRNAADEKPAPVRSASAMRFLIFPVGQPVEIACTLSGFAAPKYDIRLELVDASGHTIQEHRQSFSQSAPVAGTEQQSGSPVARTVWRLPGAAAGFYRVRATAEAAADKMASGKPAALAEMNFVVVAPQKLPDDSEFGWSLGPHDADVGLVPLGDLLSQSGIHWVKFPIPCKEIIAPPAENSVQDEAQKSASATKKPQNSPAKPSAENSLESLISFNDRLERAGVSMVGLLQPPTAPDEVAGRSHELLAAETFGRDPKSWYPSIEPILSRLATEIRAWQLGNDRDAGWAGCRDLPGIVTRTKAQLDQIGQDLDVGIAWNPNEPLPAANLVPGSGHSLAGRLPSPGGSPVAIGHRPKTPWQFLSMPCDAGCGSDRMAQALDDMKSAGVRRWIVLESLPRQGHTPGERICNLVDRMATAKMHAADAIFISDPLDTERGLFDRNGSPSELFLPWRTTALVLGGAAYAGDLDLPQGNEIHCFTAQGRYMGLIAGGKPGKDSVYLGTELRALDVWGNGRACPPTIPNNDTEGSSEAAPQSSISVQPTPVFLTELDGPLTQWQLNTAFSPDRLPSVPNALVPVTLELRNSFPIAIAGKVTVRPPKNFYLDPSTFELRLDAGAAWKQRLQVALPNDVVGGRQLLRLDFEIRADRLYRFTMYRPLTVTLGDVMFNGRAVLNDHGGLEVQQTLINTGKRAASFRCSLQVPDRQRQSSEVSIQPTGRSDFSYHLSDGDQLAGKVIWLRAEEIDGPRVLNFRIEVPAVAASPATGKRFASSQLE
jgi:hypothetical protein